MPLRHEEVEALLKFRTDPEQLKRIHAQLALVEYTYKLKQDFELQLQAQKMNLRVAIVEAEKLGASLKDIAEVLDVSRQYVTKLSREGQLEHYKRKLEEDYRLAAERASLGSEAD